MGGNEAPPSLSVQSHLCGVFWRFCVLSLYVPSRGSPGASSARYRIPSFTFLKIGTESSQILVPSCGNGQDAGPLEYVTCLSERGSISSLNWRVSWQVTQCCPGYGGQDHSPPSWGPERIFQSGGLVREADRRPAVPSDLSPGAPLCKPLQQFSSLPSNKAKIAAPCSSECLGSGRCN